jgi:hypothetical protein
METIMSEKLRSDGPLDAADCSASLARDSAKATDEILSAEITAMVGDGWMIADLRGRLQSVRVRDEPRETILLDGKPLVELWPVELETVNEGGKITIKATRRYRTFRPQNAEVSRGDGSAGQNPNKTSNEH